MNKEIISNVLVIGGLGFIGQSLTNSLLSKGYDVDITTSSHKIKQKNAFSITYDEKGFYPLLSNKEYDDIYFLSGNPSPSNSENNPFLDINTSNLYFLSLLNVAANCNFNGRIWFASSVAVYGSNKNSVLSENDSCYPISFYGVSKLMSEEHMKLFNRVYGLKIGAFRIFSTYGEKLKRQLIYDVYKKIKMNPSKIELFGTGYEARDISYVQDQVDAMILIAENNIPNGEIWNIGSGKVFTVKKVVSLITDIMGVNTDVVYNGLLRKYDGLSWKADISKLKSLNFSQKFSLKKGLKKTIKGYESG